MLECLIDNSTAFGQAKPKPPTESKHDMAKGEMDVGPAKSESEKGNDAAIVVDPGKPELEVGDDNKGANKHKDDQETEAGDQPRVESW